MGRNPCCSKEGLNRGAWTAVEDKILTEYIKVHGEGKWRNLPKRAGLKRCGKSCRLRWLNYLRPDIKRGNITHDEEELIIRLHNLLGNRWSLIAGRLPGRTDNEIKNYWNTNIGKKIQSGHPAAASNNNSTCHTKPSSSQHKLSSLSPNKTKAHSSAPSNPSNTGVENSRVVRTKATRCTKVILLPHHDPQNVPPPLDHDPQHDNSSKLSAVDTVPPSAVDSELVNDSDDQMVAAGCVGLGNDQYEPFVPFVPDDHDQEISNTSQFMVGHHDFELDEKFLSDFLNIDGLDDQLELSSDCFANLNESGHDLQVGEDFQNIRDKGSDEALLFSDQDLLFGVELQSGAGSLIDPNEIDWLQD